MIDDAALLAQFRESQDRIRSMALIHETLYQSQDLARLDLALYIHTLSADLRSRIMSIRSALPYASRSSQSY